MPNRRRTSTGEAHRCAHRREQNRHDALAIRHRIRERKLSESGTELLNFPSNHRFNRTSSNRSKAHWEPISLHTSSIHIDAITKVVEDGTILSLKLPFKLRLGSDSLEVVVCSPEELTENFFFSILMVEPILGYSTDSSFDLSTHLIQLESEQTPSLRVEIRCCGFRTDIDFTSSIESYMLEQALVALALNMIGRERNDQHLLMQAMIIENHSLSQLKTGLRDYDDKECSEKFEILLSTAMTMAVTELMVNDCEERLQIHLKGVDALIKHAESTTPLGEEILENYGDVKLPFHTLDRRPNMPVEPAPSCPDACPEKEERKVEEKVEDKINEKMDEEMDEKVDEKVNEKMDEKMDEKVDEKMDEKMDEKVDEKTDEKLDDKVDEEKADKQTEKQEEKESEG